LAVGRVLRPHALTGELKVEIHTDYPERFVPGEQLYLGEEHTPYVIEGVRFHQGTILLKMVGIDDRNAAETKRGQWVRVTMADAVPLKEGQVYLHEILHLRVETLDGEDLGEVTEIIETGANLVYVVSGEQGEILLPDIDKVVQEIDVPGRRMLVHLIDGLR
jgi:16S rRNA processing protein RimM